MRNIFFILLLMLSCNVLASAEISIGTLFDYMAGQQGTYLKRIRNQGDTTAFVKVAIHEITYDGAGQPRESAELTEGNRALIASPSRLIIPAKGYRLPACSIWGCETRSAISGFALFPCCPGKRMDSIWMARVLMLSNKSLPA